MMIASGAMPKDVTNAQLLEQITGETHEEKMQSMEKILSLVAEKYWIAHGL